MEIILWATDNNYVKKFRNDWLNFQFILKTQ